MSNEIGEVIKRKLNTVEDYDDKKLMLNQLKNGFTKKRDYVLQEIVLIMSALNVITSFEEIFAKVDLEVKIDEGFVKAFELLDNAISPKQEIEELVSRMCDDLL